MWDVLLCTLGSPWEWLLWLFLAEDRWAARVVLLVCGLCVLAAALVLVMHS